MFADHWSQTVLALSAGVMSREPNLLTQIRSTPRQVARVPLLPLYILLALKAIYVIAVIALAIGAYCFTHPAETEIVKTQLSTRGLAAAHFDEPDILQSKVVSQLSERLQPATAKDDQADLEDPAKGGLKRAATFLGDIYVFVAKKVQETVKPFTDPSRQKLLPDWPIPQVPADTPPVPVLVLDLEDTLVHSEWSVRCCCYF